MSDISGSECRRRKNSSYRVLEGKDREEEARTPKPLLRKTNTDPKHPIRLHLLHFHKIYKCQITEPYSSTWDFGKFLKRL
jgi:hypothetical protein